MPLTQEEKEKLRDWLNDDEFVLFLTYDGLALTHNIF
jgi:hypothetical protein